MAFDGIPDPHCPHGSAQRTHWAARCVSSLPSAASCSHSHAACASGGQLPHRWSYSSDLCGICWTVQDFCPAHVLSLPRFHTVSALDSLPRAGFMHSSPIFWAPQCHYVDSPGVLGQGHTLHPPAHHAFQSCKYPIKLRQNSSWLILPLLWFTFSSQRWSICTSWAFWKLSKRQSQLFWPNFCLSGVQFSLQTPNSLALSMWGFRVAEI